MVVHVVLSVWHWPPRLQVNTCVDWPFFRACKQLMQLQNWISQSANRSALVQGYVMAHGWAAWLFFKNTVVQSRRSSLTTKESVSGTGIAQVYVAAERSWASPSNSPDTCSTVLELDEGVHGIFKNCVDCVIVFQVDGDFPSSHALSEGVLRQSPIEPWCCTVKPEVVSWFPLP